MYVPSATGCNGTKTTSGPMFNRLGALLQYQLLCAAECSATHTSSTASNMATSRVPTTQLRGPGQANWDMSLYKDFPIHENVTFNFRVESFNLFNRVQFVNPNTSVGNALFGQITPGSGTGTQNNPRALQFSGRILF